jgi:drug/metabolite transporter (DMT)-like permease
MPHRRAVVLLVAASILWSLGGLLIKSIDLPSMAKAGGRSAIACVVLLAWSGRPRMTWRPTQLAAAIGYAATVSLFVIANDCTTAANAIFLQYTAPIYVALFGSWLLGEPARRIDWICIVIALAGIALFFRDQFSSTGLIGIAAALASGVSFAVMVMALRKERDASPESALLIGNVITAVVGLPFAIGHSLSPQEGWLLLALGVVQLGIPYILYSLAIRGVTALEAILIPMLEPILNPLWVALAQHEIPGPWSLIGGALVLGAIVVRGLLSTRANEPRIVDTGLLLGYDDDPP